MMADRRSLIEGLKPPMPLVDQKAENEFVFGKKGNKERAERQAKAPLTTRIRADFAATLKRASLQRQLDGVTPHTLQEILEEALEPWLAKHGYLP
jgi:hypothetical protein